VQATRRSPRPVSRPPRPAPTVIVLWSDGVTWPSASVVVVDTGDLDSFRWLVDLLGPSGAPNTWRAAYLGAAS